MTIARTMKRLVMTRWGQIICLPDMEDWREARRRVREERRPYQERLAAVVAAGHPYPAERFSGRGVVICAGGRRYFTCAWVNIHMLRRSGCTLPVEVWYLGPEEMTPAMKALLAPLGVRFVDGREVRKDHPVRILNGWELKPYAIIHSRFREVLYLDADNMVCANPEYLFDTPPYRETGAIFWPDFGRLGRRHEIWQICEIGGNEELEFESGQIVVDKARCWKALQVTMHLNEYSDFYYRYIWGDKETFHMAWRKLRQPFAMPSRGIDGLPGVMCQHDFEGRRIFQHRSLRKWTLDGDNPATEQFLFEAECLALLEALRHSWSASAA